MLHPAIFGHAPMMVIALAVAVGCEGSSAPSVGPTTTSRVLEAKSVPNAASAEVPGSKPQSSSAVVGDLAALIASRQFPSVTIDGQSLVLLTPGQQEEQTVLEALRFLRGKKVDIPRLTHAMVREVDGKLEATLLEVVGGSKFGGYEFSVTLEKSSRKVSDWRQGQ